MTGVQTCALPISLMSVEIKIALQPKWYILTLPWNIQGQIFEVASQKRVSWVVERLQFSRNIFHRYLNISWLVPLFCCLRALRHFAPGATDSYLPNEYFGGFDIFFICLCICTFWTDIWPKVPKSFFKAKLLIVKARRHDQMRAIVLLRQGRYTGFHLVSNKVKLSWK